MGKRERQIKVAIVPHKGKVIVTKLNYNVYVRKYRKQKNTDETSGCSAKRNDDKQKNTAYKREYRKKKKGDETRNRGAKSNHDKQKHNAYMREYRKTIAKTTDCSTSPSNLISMFHDIVSRGPLYICTCCDQLWYKHSVSRTET